MLLIDTPMTPVIRQTDSLPSNRRIEPLAQCGSGQ